MSNKTVPNYLRLHRGLDQRKSSAINRRSSDPTNAFWTAFSDATGWRIDQRQDNPSQRKPESSDEELGLNSDSRKAAVDKGLAEKLAKSGQMLVTSLHRAQEALREQEIELAARAAVIQDNDKRQSLATELDRVLGDAVRACHCQAALLYTLDEKTRFLSLRASRGIAETREVARSRPLRGSRGDLEAMVSGAVMINDLSDSEINRWACPDSAAAAICVPVNSGDVPVGTLWLLADVPQSFDSGHASAATLAAREIALLLERAVRDSSSSLNGKKVSIRDLANWQMSSLPCATSLAPGWFVDGMMESNSDWTVGWHTWDVLPDGSLMIAMAQAEDASLAGAMVAATGRAALSAHSGYRHTPSEIMQRISDTLWHTNTAEQLLSLMYVRLDPESGEGHAAISGNMDAMIANEYGFRPLTAGNMFSLGQHIDAQVELKHFRLGAGELLLGYGMGMRQVPNSQSVIGQAMREAMQSQDPHVLASIRRSVAKHPIEIERAAISVRRAKE